MSRFVCWKTLLTRLATVAVALLAIQYALCLFVRSSIVRHGEALLGAKVELAHARVSLFDKRLELHDLRVANPRRPLEYLLEVDHCRVDVGVAALLHKPVVVERGSVTGLRIGVPRETSGTLADAPSVADTRFDWNGGRAVDFARDWLERLAEQFDEDLLGRLESIRLADELARRWPAQLSAFEERAVDLQRRGRAMQERSDAAQANPLRHGESLRKLPAETASLQQDFAQLAAELEGVPDLLDAEREAIRAARLQDEELLRGALRIETIDANALSSYLLREQLEGPLGEMIVWLRWLREFAPADPEPPHDSRRAPHLIVRTLELQGTTQLFGQPSVLRGKLHDFSTQPARHGQPMRLVLATNGSLPVQLAATLDRTGGVPCDELRLEVLRLPSPLVRLGSSDKLQLTVAPSMASLRANLRAEGDRLSGDLQLDQSQVKITPEVGGALRRVRLDGTLEDALDTVESIAVRLSLSGTLDEPRLSLQSNLGPAVAEAMERALRRAADEHARAALALSQQRIDEQLADLQRQTAMQTAELREPLASLIGELEQNAGAQQPPDRLSVEQLGRRLPAGSLFR